MQEVQLGKLGFLLSRQCLHKTAPRQQGKSRQGSLLRARVEEVQAWNCAIYFSWGSASTRQQAQAAGEVQPGKQRPRQRS